MTPLRIAAATAGVALVGIAGMAAWRAPDETRRAAERLGRPLSGRDDAVDFGALSDRLDALVDQARHAFGRDRGPDAGHLAMGAAVALVVPAALALFYGRRRASAPSDDVTGAAETELSQLSDRLEGLSRQLDRQRDDALETIQAAKP